jgi:transcriptional antiterminator NusG
MVESEGAVMEPPRDAELPEGAEAREAPAEGPAVSAVVERGAEAGSRPEAEAEPVGFAAPPAVAAQVPPAAAEVTETPTGEEPDDGRRWYVVHCYSGYEGKVRHNLEQRVETMGMKSKIFDVVIPTEEEIEVKEGKRRTVERHVFPGYILVQMLMDEDSWYVVRNTPGVTGFVGMGNEPTPLRPEEVAQIIRRMEAEAPRVKVTYKAGQRVRIIDGPFNDFIGTVDEIDMERAKVRVMVSFFGRETPVELDFLQVEKA